MSENMKRIAKIKRIPSFLYGKEYKIELQPNYGFDFNGLDCTTVTTVHKVFEATKHIVFCDGT